MSETTSSETGTPPPSPPSFWEKRWSRLVRKKRMTYSIGLFLLFALTGVSWKLYLEQSLRFPRVESGSYMGTIYLKASRENIPFYLEREGQGNEIFIALLSPGWDPSVVTGITPSAAQNEEYLPISISSGGKSITFTGAREGDKGLKGTLFLTRGERAKKEEGKWELRAVPTMPELLSEEDKKEVMLWLLLNDERAGVEEKLQILQSKAPVQRAEINKLTTYIAEGERLKARAQEKLSLVKGELTKAVDTLNQRQESAKKLQATLDIAQKVTGMGRLVSLAREGLDREARWIETMTRTGGGEVHEELDAAIDRAEKVIALKKEIAKERAKIEVLLTPVPQKEGAEPDSKGTIIPTQPHEKGERE